MRNKKIFLTMVLLVLSTILFIPNITALQPKTIEIGVIAPNQYNYESTIILFEEIIEPDINDYVGELSRFRFTPKIRFDFIVEHADSNPDIHQQKVEMFHEMGVDLIIGGYYSSQAAASLEYIKENDMLMVSPSSTIPELALDDSLFRLAPDDTVNAIVIAAMMDSKDIDNAIVLYRDDPWGQELYSLLADEYEGTILGAFGYPPGTEDYAPYLDLTNIAAQGAVNFGVVLLSWGEAVEIILQAESYYDLFNPPWFGTEVTAKSEQILDMAPDQAAYIKLYSPLSSPDSYWKFDEFAARYEESTGNEPGFYQANEFDAAWLIVMSVLETRPSFVAGGSPFYDTTDIIRIFPDVASRYYGYSGWCCLNEEGDRHPHLFDIWSYDYDDGWVVYWLSGSYDIYADETKWY